MPAAAGRTRPTGARKVIPYPAVVYDTDGSTWTYVKIAAGTTCASRSRSLAINGTDRRPGQRTPAGRPVVTVGAAELLGAEYNISGEE